MGSHYLPNPTKCLGNCKFLLAGVGGGWVGVVDEQKVAVGLEGF